MDRAQPRTPTGELTLPKSHRELLRTLATLPDAVFQRVLRQFAGAAEGLQRSQVEEGLRSAVPELADSAGALINVLLSAHHVRGTQGLDTTAMTELLVRSLTDDLAPASPEAAAERFKALLDQPELSRVARAFDVLTEEERIFHTARMVTDVRPIFSDDVSEAPTAAVLVHTLKIDHHEYPGEVKSFFLALDEADIRRLKAVLERELLKAEALRGALGAAGIRIIDFGGESDD